MARWAPLEQQRAWLATYTPGLRVAESGRVTAVGDGIVWVAGLPSAAIDDVLEFEDGSQALVCQLAEDSLGGILLRSSGGLATGMQVRSAGWQLTLPVGEAVLGRVLDPLGGALDEREAPDCVERGPLDILSPPIVDRDFVSRPLFTGNRIVDTMIPIGRGQRQLFIGDNGLGKTTLALDVVLRQRDQGVRCVYVAIGQRRASVAGVLEALRRGGALDYTCLVAADAASLPGLQYLAPFAGAAVAEYWMRRGQDTLVVYDDLTTHADCYRELSLLLRRPPGREAFPADIFYLHARLLERAASLSRARGGGTMTALALAETHEGELATYIPTNLISITDGQVYFAAPLFSAGILPAIDVTRSVSRIGGAAQPPAIRTEAGRMKLDYLRFLELEVFTRFGAKLEASIALQIHRGRLLREILKQAPRMPQAPELHLAWLVAFNEHRLDSRQPADMADYLHFLTAEVPALDLQLGSGRSRWAAAMTALTQRWEERRPPAAEAAS
ncbi:MAG TPA: F0F1 ATP synthase subunit alpha [Terriglobales bacterium]|nr:F0F1 ATP synthase subunit alpha [Terriglobales bacterium]